MMTVCWHRNHQTTKNAAVPNLGSLRRHTQLRPGPNNLYLTSSVHTKGQNSALPYFLFSRLQQPRNGAKQNDGVKSSRKACNRTAQTNQLSRIHKATFQLLSRAARGTFRLFHNLSQSHRNKLAPRVLWQRVACLARLNNAMAPFSDDRRRRRRLSKERHHPAHNVQRIASPPPTVAQRGRCPRPHRSLLAPPACRQIRIHQTHERKQH